VNINIITVIGFVSNVIKEGTVICVETLGFWHA
jgi:hypothetical protein